MTHTDTTVRPADQVPSAGGGMLASLWHLRSDPLAYFSRLRREHGVIVRVPVPRMSLYLVSDPASIQDAFTGTNRAFAKGVPDRGDPAALGTQPLQKLLGDGLLTAPPEIWRPQRRLIQPLFHHERIAEYGDTFAGLSEEAAGQWRDGDSRDVHHDMTELTLAIIARTVFDVDLGDHVMTTIRGAMQSNPAFMGGLAMPGRELLEKLPLPANRRFAADRDTLDSVVHQLIADRRAQMAAHPAQDLPVLPGMPGPGPGTPGSSLPGGGLPGGHGRDLLTLLLSARDADTGQPMSDQQVRDEALTLLLAGHETTANALAWSLHLLATHPAAQERLAAELDEVLGSRVPGAADMADLPYTTAVLHEAMRLYPPAWVVARHLVAEHDVSGFRLPAGSMILMSQWVVHRDPQWWADPDSFTPERWLGAGSSRPRYAYFPFGGGPRQCIGNSFAEMEGVLVLATLARHWQVSPTPGAPAVVPEPLVTLRPRDGVTLTLHRR